MNIEDLSKSQLLLLMLFVNFIISIAVGVMTASILDQAPTTVTQTVNRVIDHTIETVATGTPLATIVAPPTTITKTVIQNDSDLLPGAIATLAAHTVQIYSSAGTSTPVLELGTYLPSARAVVTDTLAAGLPNEITVQFPDGTVQKASLSHAGATITIYGFGDTGTLPKAPTSNIVAHTTLQAGQSAVAITADGSAVDGIISKIDDAGVHTNLPAVPAGTAAVNISGDIIGISTGVAGMFLPADKITTLLTATSTAASS